MTSVWLLFEVILSYISHPQCEKQVPIDWSVSYVQTSRCSFSIKHLHVFRLNRTLAVQSYNNTVRTYSIFPCALCGNTMMSSKKTKANYHLTGDKMVSMGHWKRLGALKGLSGIQESWYTQWCEVSVVLSSSSSSIYLPKATITVQSWEYQWVFE